MVHVAQEHHSVHHHGAQEQQEQVGPEAVGRRLSLVLSKTRCPAMIVAYFPKTRKHRIRFDCSDHQHQHQHEKNVLLNTLDYSWVDADKQHPSLSSHQLAIRRHAVGRRMDVFHHVRQRWYQATVLQYVEHCQQHTVVLEPQGKVHLVDLQQCPWRYTDLIGASASSASAASSTRNPRDLATSKYLGVVRCAENAWKAHYTSTSENKYIGCFESEKDAALAYDVYARKRQTTVNFLDRRICRAQMKLLRIAEPEPEHAVMEEVPSTPVAVPVTVTVTPEMVESLPELPSKSSKVTTTSTADIVLTSSTEEETSTHVMDAEAPVEHVETSSSSSNNTNTRPDPEGVLASSMVEEVEPELDVECAVAQQTQDPPEHSGRVTPVSVTEEVLGHDEHSTASHTTEEEEEEEHNQSSLDDSATSFPEVEEVSQRRISTSSEEDLPQAAAIKATAAQAARVNIFEDSEDEQECPVKTDKASTVACNNKNIFESDIDDEESVHVTPKRKRKKKDKPKSSSKRHHQRRVIEETPSSDEDDAEMDSSEYLPSPEPRKKVKEIKLPTSTTSQKKKKKRKRSSSPTPTTAYQHKYSVGTRFMKEFEDFGSFEGVITAHNGRHYQVYYAADGDEEELSEYEFENYEILPNRNAASSSQSMACPPTPIAQKRQKNCHRRKKKRRANAILD